MLGFYPLEDDALHIQVQDIAPAPGVSAEMLAATLSWAIYGAAKEWVRTPGRCRSEEVVGQVMGLVGPMFGAAIAGQ